jgi:hypothetical protein
MQLKDGRVTVELFNLQTEIAAETSQSETPKAQSKDGNDIMAFLTSKRARSFSKR